MADVEQAELSIRLPDGSSRELQTGATGADLAADIGPGLARAALAIHMNGRVCDLSTPLEPNADVAILTFSDPEGREVFWHSTAHVMAQAVMDLFPGTQLAIGPPIDEGFYYDFEVARPFGPEDLEAIEKRMAEIIKGNHAYSCREMSRDEAREHLLKSDERYKLEILDVPGSASARHR
jgi:threonyl-tRNA synthetase